MNSVRVLIVSDEPDLVARSVAAGREQGISVTRAPLETSGCDLSMRDDFEILAIHLPPTGSVGGQLLGDVRFQFHGHALQIVALVDSEPEYQMAVEAGADDVISTKASQIELSARLQAAVFRYEGQHRLVREREFFRRALHDEETVNSKMVDRIRHLRNACKSLDSIRHKLERSNVQLEKVARFDMLSGLLNRVTLFSAMDMEIERTMRSGAPLSGFMTDIDNFKIINDNWGHPSGDEVIRAIGSRMNKSLRKYDQAGRYGGEEFFVLLPNARLDKAHDIAERFRANLKNTPVSFGSERVFVTASIGVAEFRATEARDVWVTRADQAMYMAKQQGRDRVCVLN